MVLCWLKYFKQLECSAALEALDTSFSGEVVAALARLPSSRRRRVPDQSGIPLCRAASSASCGDAERQRRRKARPNQSAVGQLAEKAT
jgi:hypothetical protein